MSLIFIWLKSHAWRYILTICNSKISPPYTVPKVIDFPIYNTKCSGENEILRRIFRVVSRFPQHFVLYISEILIPF